MDFVVKGDALFLGEKKLRVTSDMPKRISVLDTIAGVSGQHAAAAAMIWKRLNGHSGEV